MSSVATQRDVVARHPVRTVVDAHVHFWDPAQLRYPWLDTIAALQHRFLPADYSAAVGDLPVGRCVAVEANCLPYEAERELELFEELADGDARIAGVVAFVDLTDDVARAERLGCIASRPGVKGIRQNIQGQPAGFALQRTFVEGVREVGRNGLTFDLCVAHHQLEEAAALVARCPGTQFVLDHCGKPPIRAGTREPWGSDIARLAAHDNVCCKLSGLLTEADAAAWSADELRPYAEHTVDCFGIDRLLYGSDWPVLTLAGDYAGWFRFTAAFTESWSDDERSRFYAGNAARVYRLSPG